MRRELSLLERVWLACAIDGEGTVFFRDNYNDPKFRGRERGRKIGILITNSDFEFISKAKEILGSNKVSFSDRGGHRKRIYRTGIFSIDQCLDILTQIAPYLIIKQQKAKFIIKHFEQRPRLKRTEEARQNISQRLKGHLVSAETREKLRIKMIGRKLSVESKAKIVRAQLGRKHTRETKELMSEKTKQVWQARKQPVA